MSDVHAPEVQVAPLSLSQDQLFQALIARFQDHTELLRSLTVLDLQVMGGFMALQLGLAAWLIDHTPQTQLVRFGLLGITAMLTVLAVKLFYNSYQRRKEVVASLTNTKTALRFGDSDVYLAGKPLDTDTIFRAWSHWYICACVITSLAVSAMILWGGFARAV